MAIGYWNNWVFSATGASRWEKAMEKLPFFVHITTNPAEMTQYADIVLPAAFHMFERWGLLTSKANRHSFIGIQQPANLRFVMVFASLAAGLKADGCRRSRPELDLTRAHNCREYGRKRGCERGVGGHGAVRERA